MNININEKERKSRIGVVNFERRHYPRFSVDLPVEYSIEESSSVYSARTGNISEGGLLIYLPERIEIGKQLRMKLFFSLGSHLNSIDMLAEVVWHDIHLGKGWGDYRCGVKFIDISDENLNKLKDFLKSLSE